MNGFLSNVHFIRPGWLLLVPVAAALWWLWQRSLDPLRGWREQVDPNLLKAMMIDERPRRSYLGTGVLIAWVLAIGAIAGPTWKQEPNPFAADAVPLMVLLKADASMDQSEFPPSALEQARLKIADLVEIRKGQPIGLIAYAGSAHLVLPPTKDTEIVAQMAAEINSEIMPQPGDRLDLALQKAGEILSREQSGGTILVIANSVEGESQAFARAAEEAGSYPTFFLALREEESLNAAARGLKADLVTLTPDDQDVITISKAAERQSTTTLAGETQRWQEAGYWFVPLLAILIAASFRRERQKVEEEPT